MFLAERPFFPPIFCGKFHAREWPAPPHAVTQWSALAVPPFSIREGVLFFSFFFPELSA